MYCAYGAARQVWTDRSPQVVLSGPAGTGKSRACLEKVWAAAERWPGARILLCRKTRRSLTDTGLVTFEDKVVPKGHPVLQGPKRSHRQSYSHPNGSEIVVAGLDDLTKIMSGEYDLIFLQEAIEATEDDWEKLTTRLRNGVIPFQQIIADTNPDHPQHWLRLRSLSGVTKMLESRHEDNPTLFDPKTGQITAFGAGYIANLDALTGARKDRLRYGRWVQAEGVVYEEWNRSVNLIDRRDIPATWKRTRVIDFGFNNPFVCQWWAEDPDSALYLYREIYFAKRTVKVHAAQIVALSAGERIEYTLADHDAEDRATLKECGIQTIAAHKAITPGIQAVQHRLKVQANGKPRLYVLRDSLVERDETLVEAKLPFCTEQEFDSYVWPKGIDGKPLKEQPVDKDNHGMDCVRYRVAQSDVAARTVYKVKIG